jgi:hypothetical protein
VRQDRGAEELFEGIDDAVKELENQERLNLGRCGGQV